MPTVPGKGEQDYRVFVGARAFDPLDEAARARRQVGAARRRRAAVAGPRARAIGSELLLVQFTSALNAPDIDRLRRDHDLKLEDYVPNLAFIELVGPQVIDALRRDFLVRATMPIDPAMKLAPAAQPAPAGAQYDAALLAAADVTALEAELTALGARDVAQRGATPVGGFAFVHFALDDPAVLSQVADIEEIVWIEPVGAKVADNVDAAAAIQTGTSDGAPIWDRGLHGELQIISVMDDGPPDIAHCFFDDPPNAPGPNHRKLVAVPRNAAATAPLTAHATAIAGIAAGDDRNLPGSNQRRGAAWAARLVCSNWNDLDPPISNLLFAELGIDAAAGAFVHSNSWHENTNPTLPVGSAPTYHLLDWQIDQFVWLNEDHVVLGSAGNAGEELGPPGTAKNAICVSAALAKPNQMSFGDGNPGPTADGRRKPDLVAVGCGIAGAAVNTPCGIGPTRCSSSRATPNAAAAVALVRQYFTEGWYPSGEKEAKNAISNPTGALLKAVLLNSTVDMTGAGAAGYPSNSEGWGLIRLDRTLYFRGQRRRMKVWDRRHANGATPGVNIITEDFEVADDTEQLKVTLVWSDPPPAFFGFVRAPAVNDLNLRVTAPNRTQYLGNDFTNGVSTPNGATADAVNNVEMVMVNNPPPGKWQLEVHGVVNRGNPGQGFALVATANLKRKKCFVATAVYGDPDHPDVCLIRDWRDGELERGGARRAAMSALAAVYDRAGPMLASAVERSPRLARALRRRVFEPAVARAARRRS